MGKIFNINGACEPDRHYMVALKPRLEEIKTMIDAGEYFFSYLCPGLYYKTPFTGAESQNPANTTEKV